MDLLLLPRLSSVYQKRRIAHCHVGLPEGILSASLFQQSKWDARPGIHWLKRPLKILPASSTYYDHLWSQIISWPLLGIWDSQCWLVIDPYEMPDASRMWTDGRQQVGANEAWEFRPETQQFSNSKWELGLRICDMAGQNVQGEVRFCCLK